MKYPSQEPSKDIITVNKESQLLAIQAGQYWYCNTGNVLDNLKTTLKLFLLIKIVCKTKDKRHC